MIRRLDNILKNESGSGMGVVIYGIVIMLVLSLVSINILNAKIIQDGYDRLRDSVEAAAAGSVLHIALGNQEDFADTNSLTSKSDYQVAYDPWLQLALGFLMTSDATGGSVGNAIDTSGGNQTVANDFIKFDRERVVTHTMKVLQDGVLKSTGNITDSKYKIKMVFLEPAYTSSLDKNIDIIVYDNTMFELKSDGNIKTNSSFKGKAWVATGSTDEDLMYDEYTGVQGVINNNVVSGVKINLEGNNDLLEGLKTRPYYFIIIEDFPLPTLFGGDTRNNIFATMGSMVEEHVTMFALQGANTNRKIDEEDKGIK